jgi:alpha-glucosidase (family GH31 glycosyl hydrolase)
MIGNDLIVKPVLEKDAKTIQVWLPRAEVWYNVFTREQLLGTGEHQPVNVTMDTFGLFARGGSIIPIVNVGE